MRNGIVLVLMLLSASAVLAAEPGFSMGNHFTAAHLEGAVTVYCGPSDAVTFTCYDSTLDPNSYDYFVGPDGVVADEVTLTNLRADGSERARTIIYDRAKNRSFDAFNLWISTIFQRPLLALGENQVDYKLLSRGKIVSQGGFVVTVTAGPPRQCPTTHYNSRDPNDCKNQYTVCQRYFEQFNHCR